MLLEMLIKAIKMLQKYSFLNYNKTLDEKNK